MTEKATDHRGCLAKGFPFWNDLTPEEQEIFFRLLGRLSDAAAELQEEL